MFEKGGSCPAVRLFSMRLGVKLCGVPLLCRLTASEFSPLSLVGVKLHPHPATLTCCAIRIPGTCPIGFRNAGTTLLVGLRMGAFSIALPSIMPPFPPLTSSKDAPQCRVDPFIQFWHSESGSVVK